MNRYIITYDLRATGRNYDDLYERIKAYEIWAKITDSTWAIRTNQTSVQVRDNLKSVMDSNDQLLVGTLGRSAWSGIPTDVSNWLLGK